MVREPPDVDRHRELRRGPRADAGHGEQARVGLVALEQRRRLGLEGPGLVEGLRYPGGQEPDLPVLGLDERRRGRRRTARRARPPCCGRGRWPAPPRRGRSGRPSATTCRRPGRARPRVWWMALSRWYPSGSRSTGWPPPRHSHYQPRHLPGTFLSAVGGGASRAGSTQRALSGGRDVRPCAGARSAARSGRASIVARDGPGLTISTVMDVLKRLAYGDSLATKASHGERHQVPAVGDGPLMSDALRGVEHHCLLCLFGLCCSASLCFTRIVACAFTRIALRDNACNRANICQLWLNNDR